MLKFLQKNFSRFFLLFLLLTGLWILVYRNNHPKSEHLTLKNLSLSLWLPVQRSVSWVLAVPENVLTAILELGHLRQEVARLQVENQSLRLELSNHKSIESELTRLQEVLQIKAKQPHQTRIARIIAHDPSTWNKSFIIDAGAEDGVTADSPIITEQGIVGRILEVSPKNSRVLLITDTSSSVAGIDTRSRVTGVVLGTGGSQLKYGYVSASEDVQVGDPIVSSGLGGVYPKGYALGTIFRKAISENGLNTDIELAPAVDLGVLDYVFILQPVPAIGE